jgi:hypothetical protein
MEFRNVNYSDGNPAKRLLCSAKSLQMVKLWVGWRRPVRTQGYIADARAYCDLVNRQKFKDFRLGKSTGIDN